MARTISTKLAVEGEAQYRQAISACNSELSTMKSSLALVESEFRGSANSMEALTAKGAALEAMYKKQQEKISTLEDALKNAQRAEEGYASRVSAAQENIDRCEKSLEKLRGSTEDATGEQEELTRELEKWTAELGEARQGQAASEQGVQRWQKQLNNAKVELNGLSDGIAENNRYLNEAATSADGCARSIDEFGNEVKESSDGIRQLAAALAAAGIAKTVKEIADELMECAAAAGGFETAMAKLSTLVDTSVYSMDGIKAQLLELSNETGVAVGALAEAAYQARSAGVETANVADFVATATKTAIAGFTDSATAVDVLTTAINAYKLEGSQAEKVASMLVRTQDEGKTSVGELAQNMGRVIPVAAACNVSLENLTASYALLTKSGANTAIATTNLSAMFNELARDGSTVADILRDETGRSFAQLMASGEDLGGIMAILSDSVDGDATAFSNLWSSTTAGQAALSLLNSGAEEFIRTMGVMETSSGAVEANFQVMADTTEMAQQRMSNAAQNLRIAIGGQLNPALEELYSAGADAFTWAADFVEEHPWVVNAIAGVTTALAALTVGVTALSVGPQIIAALQGALALLAANPIVAVTAAVVGLGAAILSWSATLDDADADTKNFTESLRESKKAYEDLTSSMSEQQGSTESLASALKDLLSVEERSAAQKDAIQRIVEQLNEAVPGLGLAYDREKDALIGLTQAEVDAALSKSAAQEEYLAQVDRLTQLYAERAEIDARLEDAEAALAAAQADVPEEMASYFDIATDYNNALAESGEGTSTLENNVRELTAALDENAAETAALEEAANAYAEKQAESAEKVNAMSTTVEGLIDEMNSLQAEYEKSYAAAMESIDRQLGLFNKLDGEARTTIDDLIGTLEGQVKYMETYAANIQKAMEMGVDQGLIKKLSDGSEESAQILAAIVEGGEEDIAALNEQLAKVEEGKESFSSTVAELETGFNEKMAAVVEDLDKAIQEMDLQNDAYRIGENNIQGLINGSVSKRHDLVIEYASMGYADLEAYKKAVDQHSPSKEFAKAGGYDVQGLIDGVRQRRGDVSAAYGDLGQASVKGYKDGAEALQKESSALLDDFLKDTGHALYLAQKNGMDSADAMAAVYREMQEQIHETAEWYRAQGYAETSDEIQKLQKLWWGYADNIASAQESVRQNAAANTSALLDDFIKDTEHALYLAKKNGTDSAEDTAAACRKMQEQIHKTAEWYRAQGYDETSDEIQKLQKLWWGYADAIGDVYDSILKTQKSKFDELASFISDKSAVADLEYQLWERTDGKWASELDKYTKQLELLSTKQEDQQAVVEAAEAAYAAVVEQYGEGTAESYEYQKALLQEKLALQDLLEEIEAVTAAKKKMSMQTFMEQAEQRWGSTGYTTPFDFAKSAGLSLTTPDGMTYRQAYEEVSQSAMYNMARARPPVPQAQSQAAKLGRQIEDSSAAIINAVSGRVQGGGAAREVVRIVTVDGREIASATFDDLVAYGDANGTPILNPRK